MRLLVSVRSALEVEAAISGGADIVDAKEPSRGSLGPVDPETLRAILERLPGEQVASAALGDVSHARDLQATIAAFLLIQRAAPVYLKIGFAGVAKVRKIASLIRAAVMATGERGKLSPVIAVAYADSELAGSARPAAVVEAAIESGAAGVLLDTHSKGSGHLFRWLKQERVRSLVDQVRQAGMVSAAAGSLSWDELELVRSVEPDIVGFRGAACEGGREGWVSRARVERLRLMLSGRSEFLQEGTGIRPAWRNA